MHVVGAGLQTRAGRPRRAPNRTLSRGPHSPPKPPRPGQGEQKVTDNCGSWIGRTHVMILVFSIAVFLPYFQQPLNLEYLLDPEFGRGIEFATKPQPVDKRRRPILWDTQRATS
jgi:hypothetical protein